MDIRLDEVKAILKKYGQEHLLNHYNKLDSVHQKQLLNEIQNIDFELINHLYNTTKKEEKNTEDIITPIDYLDKYKLNEKYKYYENIGKKSAWTTGDVIGENVYYSIYTTQIMDEISDSNVYNMKKGDILSVRVENSGRTLAQMIRGVFYSVNDNGNYQIAAQHSRVVTATASH